MTIEINGNKIDLGEGTVVGFVQTPLYSEDGSEQIGTLFKITFKAAEAA